MHAARRGREQICGAKVRELTVAARSPLTPEPAALPEAVLPEDLALRIRVQREAEAGFLRQLNRCSVSAPCQSVTAW